MARSINNYQWVRDSTSMHGAEWLHWRYDDVQYRVVAYVGSVKSGGWAWVIYSTYALNGVAQKGYASTKEEAQARVMAELAGF